MASTTNPTDFAKAVADIDAFFTRKPITPITKATPEQMAAARAAAYATVRHDGLRAGERIVNGEVYVFNADSRDADIESALAARAMERAA